MKDRLTKKRIKVDYEAIVELLNLSDEFIQYRIRQIGKGNYFSRRRCASNFLRGKHVNFYWCTIALNNGCSNYLEFINFCGSEKDALEYAYGV